MPLPVLELGYFFCLFYNCFTDIFSSNKDWVGTPVDPNDPRNTNVAHLMRRAVTDMRDMLAFSTEPHELLLLVCTEFVASTIIADNL